MAPVADFGMPSDVYPAPHASAPKVLDVGGDVLNAPTLVSITFAGDARASDLDAFASTIGASPYWTTVTHEYGVGSATAANPIHLGETPPKSITDAAIQTWIEGQLAGPTPAWGAPDKNAVYTIYYPSTTTIVGPSGQSCIQGGFNGYHGELALSDGTPIVYAVIADCANNATYPWKQLTGLDVTTNTVSHEWVEAVTDPHIDTNPAYAQEDKDHLGWIVLGGELGDMCGFNPGAGFLPSGVAHAAQRTWSNMAALGSHDPCQPHPSADAYFNSAPALPDSVAFTFSGQKVTTKGVRIPVGATGTVELDLFSDGPTSGPWTVSAVDVLTWVNQKPELSFTFDRDHGVNGEKVHLSISVLAKDPSFGAEFFAIVSTLGDQQNIWYGTVGN